MRPTPAHLRIAVVASPLFLGFAALAAAAATPISLTVDARDAARGVLHSELEMPVQSGPLALEYPKWVQGEHTPTGPIMEVTGFYVRASGQVLAWRRNPLDMFEVEVEVPPGVAAIQVSFDYLSPPEVFGDGYGETPNTTPHLAIIDWHDVLMFPRGSRAADLAITAKLRLPSGWTFDTALTSAEREDDTVSFATTSLYSLIDSPVLAGDVLQTIQLGSREQLTIAADHHSAIMVPADKVAALNRLPKEALALFGARHYRSYHWLLALGDKLDQNGLEHHESSDDRGPANFFTDPTRLFQSAAMLSHEYVHSWNGKYRRPQGLVTDDPQAPLDGELLWVYEGLTRYLGDLVLATRTGLRTMAESREYVAWIAANLDRNRPGRRWRPLVDTAISVQVIGAAPDSWTAMRRPVDYYDESLLIWLEVDSVIRTRSGGKLSLDDFCRSFYGGSDSAPAVLAYTRNDLIAALNKILPYDWAGFFATRVDGIEPHPPLAALEAAGWRLVYNATPNEYQQARATNAETVDLSFSLGVWLRNDGTIKDIDVGGPAWEAGLGPGMKIVAIDGRTWSATVAHEELAAAKEGNGTLTVAATRGEELRSFTLHYSGGEMAPHLERTTAPDLLTAIATSRAH
jgi:predicted metalloprotease with PDZ domain